VPVCLEVFLVADRYDAAGGQDPRAVEWPPHPARVFSALRSVANDDDLPTLRVLESLPPPVVHASDIVADSRSRTYVVTNTLASKGGNLNHPGRTSGLKERRSVFPLNSRLQFVWPSDDVPSTMVERLDAIARRVPYLGRSTSVVLMGARKVVQAEVPDGLAAFHPVDDEWSGLSLRVPYPGYLEELDALHGLGLSAWQASDGARARRPYRRAAELEAPIRDTAEIDSPYGDLVVLRFRDSKPDGRLIPLFTAAIRSRVMAQVEPPLPPAVHGHGLDGQPHVAYLGLPFCGHEHADGHLVALAVAIPGMDRDERTRIIRGILGNETEAVLNLDVPGFRTPFKFDFRPNDPLPRSATERHWTQSSTRWVTATPVVLDRYPKDGDLAAAVYRSIMLAGLPEPLEVETSKAGLIPGAVNFTPRELPRRARGRLYCHARVTFAQPVRGPVLAGAGRYFGVGFFLPEHRKGGGESRAG
jgi:CRISPR-associated protein Csb2